MVSGRAKQGRPQLIDDARATSDEPVEDSVECLNIELVACPERHKAHGRALHRLANGFGIEVVILLCLDERSHVLGGMSRPAHELDRERHRGAHVQSRAAHARERLERHAHGHAGATIGIRPMAPV